MTRLPRISAALLLLTLVLRSQDPPGQLTMDFVGQLPERTGWGRVVFASAMDGWWFSPSGIWRTDDGGRSWRRLAAPASHWRDPGSLDWVSLFGDRGYALRENRLYVTLDGVASWRELPQVPMVSGKGQIRGFRFLRDGQTGWVFGGILRRAGPDEDAPNNVTGMDESALRHVLQPAIARTSDGGSHWVRLPLPKPDGRILGHRVQDLRFVDAHHGAAVTEYSAIYSDDGGDHWQAGHLYGAGCTKELPALYKLNAEIRSLFLLDRQNGWLGLDDGSLYRTRNGGVGWCQVLPPHQFVITHFQSLSFVTPSLGWGLDASGVLMETHDGGITWQEVPPVTRAFSQIFFLDKDHGWALSDEGLYRLSVGGKR